MDPDHLLLASPSIRERAEDWGGKGQMDQDAYQTSLWVKQDGKKGGGRRRDST